MNEARIEERVENMLEESANVLRDAAQPNGAIVAANSLRDDYPREAENYSFVWARDNAFQIKGAAELGMPEAPLIRARYLDWLRGRAQGFADTGLIIKRYNPNGTLDARYGAHYQPDQAGALLWALAETRTEENAAQTDPILALLARGLTSRWKIGHGHPFGRPGYFTERTQDLWENRETKPENGDVFTYSAAACAHGLRRVFAIEEAEPRVLGISDDEIDAWGYATSSMHQTVENDWGQDEEPYRRKVGSVLSRKGIDQDDGLDASLTMLAYPFSLDRDLLFFKDRHEPRVAATVRAIGRELCSLPGGVKRYEGDTYDGLARPDGREATAGSWPLLSFQQIVAYHRIGEWAAGRELFQATIEVLDDLYRSGALPENCIPEQIFLDGSGREGRGVLPLAWAHAVFPTAVSAYRAMTETVIRPASSTEDLHADEE